TNDANNALVGNFADQVAAEVRRGIAESIGTEAAEQFLLGFSTVHDKTMEAANGANQLADGAGQVHDGAGQLQQGTNQLSAGANELLNGRYELAARPDGPASATGPPNDELTTRMHDRAARP